MLIESDIESKKLIATALVKYVMHPVKSVSAYTSCEFLCKPDVGRVTVTYRQNWFAEGRLQLRPPD